VEEARGMVE
jgi:hypothetical protein